MPCLLVIDDDPAIALIAVEAVRNDNVQVIAAATAAEGFAAFDRHVPDAVLLDVLLPDEQGLAVFRRLQQRDSKIPVIFATTRGKSDVAIEAMRQGAFDFLVKPLESAKLRELTLRACEVRRLARLPPEVRNTEELTGAEGDMLIGRSPVMQQVYKNLGRAANHELPVLLLGETGAGKELAARAIHRYSARADKPFDSVDCAGQTETALESEFFGHERRAFPQAEKQRIGALEGSVGGVCYIDAAATLPLGIQAKLVKFMETKTYRRLGGEETFSSDARLLFGSCVDLAPLVAAGRFRSDLHYLLQGCTIELPPLRRRLEDLPALASHFIKQFNASCAKRASRLAQETLARLAAHDWPGNVRELQSVVKQMLVQSSGAVLLPEFLPPLGLPRAEAPACHSETGARAAIVDWEAWLASRLRAGSVELHAEASALMERHLLSLLLKQTEGNQAQAAKLLGITRGSLRQKLRSLGIVLDRSIDVHARTPSAAAGP